MEVENQHPQFSALQFCPLVQPKLGKIFKNLQIIDLEQPNIKLKNPKGRFDHLSWIYKDRIFIFGGSILNQNNHQNLEENIIYSFHLIQKTWSNIKPRLLTKNIKFQILSSMAMAQNNHRVYIFGGSNNNFECNQELLKLDLQTFEINSVQQRGQIPLRRQGAKMTYYDRNWLILYGGIDCEQIAIYNDFYFFSIQARTWYKVQGAYQFLLSYRDHSSLLCHSWNKKLYLFGGSYFDSLNQKRFLNDLYQINVVFKAKLKPTIMINKILPKSSPAGRSGQSLNSLNQKYLILIGGQGQSSVPRQNSQSFFEFRNQVLEDVWIFSIQKRNWFKLAQDHSPLVGRYAFSCSQNQQGFYIFGGLNSNEQPLDDLFQIKVNIEKIDKLDQLYKNQICRLCWQENNQYEFKAVQFSCSYVDSILSTIQYPFAAFGLLIDNAVHFQSNKL